jgi:hypothetical protein
MNYVEGRFTNVQFIRNPHFDTTAFALPAAG